MSELLKVNEESQIIRETDLSCTSLEEAERAGKLK